MAGSMSSSIVHVVMFSHMMPLHAKKRPSSSHIVPKPSITTFLANLEGGSVVIDLDVDDDAKD